ncbi:hypothetical protein H310_05757 [Aphanomyces invadans]|uniref:Uncharacterized protein n=1 Tax=Aphanomyces invadans TaxID=157072 RepID=A0A024U7J1_9STRA|nr:hypothetical protein H310_05757 [Aphanomyces invadans]ETW02190.1 hypothetical protein H310_05757 [Aphanomyces invadans]|eukprot:XP_008868795.1 hypothetical protein H310_05757 [Aphanomyces invadans]
MEPPPPRLIHLFAHAPMQPDVQMHHARRGLGVAEGLNESFSGVLEQVEGSVRLTKRKFEELGDIIKCLENQIDAAKQLLANNAVLIDGFEQNDVDHN